MVEIVSMYLVGIVIDLTIIDRVSSFLSLGTWKKDNKDNKNKDDYNKEDHNKDDHSLNSTTKNFPKKSKINKTNYLLKKIYISSVNCWHNF